MTPIELVRKLVEDDAGDDVDPKDFLEKNSEEMLNKWEQVDGDYGNPWVYGGTWYNAFSQEIVHTEGLEGEGVADISPWDITISDEEKAQILAQYPVFIDPEYPQAGDENERDREMAEEELKTTKATAEYDSLKIPVYRFRDEELDSGDWPDQEAVAAQFDAEGTYANMPRYDKWIEIGRYYGFHELDSAPYKYTKAELSELLGVEL